MKKNAGAKKQAEKKSWTASEMGKKGGLIGGKARAAKLTAKRRREIAKQAAAARWGKKT